MDKRRKSTKEVDDDGEDDDDGVSLSIMKMAEQGGKEWKDRRKWSEVTAARELSPQQHYLDILSDVAAVGQTQTSNF